MHPREEIRAKVAELIGEIDQPPIHVYDSRLYRLPDSQLPGAVVWTKNEDSGRETVGDDGLLMRSLDVEVELIVKASESLAHELDELALVVETKLGSHEDLVGVDGLTTDFYLTGTDIQYEPPGEGGDDTLGVATLTFMAAYYTEIDNPGGTP